MAAPKLLGTPATPLVSAQVDASMNGELVMFDAKVLVETFGIFEARSDIDLVEDRSQATISPLDDLLCGFLVNS